MPNRTLIVLTLLAFFGCAHFKSVDERKADFELLLKNSVGKSINDMILNVGPPTKTFQMPNGDVIYTWSSEQRRYVASTTANSAFRPRNARVVPAPELTTGTSEIVYSCETSFVAGKDGIISRWLWKGNSCF